MSLNTNGTVSVTIIAGPVERPDRKHGYLGAMLRMGEGNLYFHITPEVAAQWLPVITEIAEEGE